MVHDFFKALWHKAKKKKKIIVSGMRGDEKNLYQGGRKFFF